MKEKRETDKQGDEQRDSADEERDRIEDVVAANRELRARVDELETALTDLTEVLTEGDQDVLADDSETDVNSLRHEVDDTPELATSGGQPTKVIGRLSDTDGIGVLGEATGSGATNGVRGVAGSPSGYGLFTPDDARAEGDIETGGNVSTTNLNLSGEVYADSDFQLYAGGSRNMVIEPQTNDEEAGNVVFGAIPNYNDTTAAHGATVGGGGIGGQFLEPNVVHDNFGTVGGGKNNTAGKDDGSSTSARYTTVSGGRVNIADRPGATVGGGSHNTAGDGDVDSNDGTHATVAGGLENAATHDYAIIGGGWDNKATGQLATVPGGWENNASGFCSFAAGRQAKAQHDGAFVFGDHSSTQITTSNPDEARFQVPIHTSYVDASEGYRGAIGSSAYFPNNFSVTSSFQRLPFNTLIADQRGEFDTNNNLFECAYDGAYVVELGLESVDSGDTSGNVDVEMEILQGSAGSNPASEQAIAWNFQPSGNDFAKTFTKTIFGLKAGNQIAVKIRDTAESLDITGSPDETFLVVRQVGGGGENTSSPITTNVTTTADSEQDE